MRQVRMSYGFEDFFYLAGEGFRYFFAVLVTQRLSVVKSQTRPHLSLSSFFFANLGVRGLCKAL